MSSHYSQISKEMKITHEERKTIDELARYALSGEWDDIVHMYKTHGAVAHTAALNKAGDTALRIAISAGKKNIAKQLIDEAAKTEGALEWRDKRGLTVLHIAAYFGDRDLCAYIAGKNTSLIGIRNDVKETPLFYAAHFGHIDAFLTLQRKCKNEDVYVYGRRGDGETILHTAISRRYYEIAYHIIILYPKFVYAINEKGFSPLLVMASTPSAFRSGCPEIRGIHQLLYYLIHVSKLKMRADVIEDEKEHHEKQQTYISSPWHRIMAFIGCSKNLQDQSKDEEGQHTDGTHNEEEQGSYTSKNGSQGPNRRVSVIGSSLHRMAVKVHAMSVVFGPGKYWPKKLKETKKNNVWSEQIMKELVYGYASFQYEHNGMSPGLDPVVEMRLGN